MKKIRHNQVFFKTPFKYKKDSPSNTGALLPPLLCHITQTPPPSARHHRQALCRPVFVLSAREYMCGGCVFYVCMRGVCVRGVRGVRGVRACVRACARARVRACVRTRSEVCQRTHAPQVQDRKTQHTLPAAPHGSQFCSPAAAPGSPVMRAWLRAPTHLKQDTRARARAIEARGGRDSFLGGGRLRV